MKAKLTISVDSALVPRAKRFARSRGVSLSALIEDGLRNAVRAGEPSFAARWQGKFRPARRGDARCRALARKYL
jgi:post-segregation antitoxin (ccd killing protein)